MQVLAPRVQPLFSSGRWACRGGVFLLIDGDAVTDAVAGGCMAEIMLAVVVEALGAALLTALVAALRHAFSAALG